MSAIGTLIPLVGRLIMALFIGAIGGLAFFALNLPLPFMLGAITATMIAALSGAPMATPKWVRPPLSAIIGTMLGAGFPSDVLRNALDWVVPLGGLLLYMLAAGAACIWYFHRLCRFDFKTAYFCGMPGGLVEMTLLGDSLGADARRIALIHTARILLVVFSVSGSTRLFFEIDPSAAADVAARVYHIADLTFGSFAWLTATCIAGVAIGRLLRLPAGFLLGPMLISATLHISDFTDFEIPRELLYAAQVGLGTTIGCRFVGQRFREVGHLLLLSLGSTAVVLSLTLLFSWAVNAITGIDFLLLVLAYSPGGLAEMGLVALYLHLDTALVACHHIFRVVLVGFSSGLIFKAMQRYTKLID